MQATYVGADALTLEQSVATPIEQQMSGVDNMIYMYSVNASNGQMTLRVNFDVATNPNDDQILTQMRYLQAESQLPQEVRNFGVTIKNRRPAPWRCFRSIRRTGTYDNIWLANYAYININDPDDARARRRPGDDLRRRAICHAVLGAAGQLAKLEHHGPRDSRRHQGAEHREPGRADRRRAGSAGTGIHLYGPSAGPAGQTAEEFGRSSSAPIPTGPSCGSRTSRGSSSARRPTT